MAREFLRITPETTWGTFNTGGTHTVIDLPQNNAFTLRPAPVPYVIRSAVGFNRRRQTGSSKIACSGNLSFIAYGSQMAVVAPWICASSSNVLGSCTVDHCYVMEDAGATKVYRRYLGTMVDQATLSCSEQDTPLRVALQLTAGQPAAITGTDFPEPAATAYPTDAPYVFEHASGAVTVGTARAEWDSFSLTIKNTLDKRFMGTQYLTRLKYCGSDVDASFKFPNEIATDRADFEAVTAVAASVIFTNGAHVLTLQMESQNFITKCDDDLPLDKLFLQGVDIANYFDPTAGNSFAITAT